MHQVWRLNEYHEGNLSLACTEEGLVLGRTALIERQETKFAVRERTEIERLLGRAYGTDLPVDRLMSGLATVATALNANDPGLARIAAVHLRIPDLPDLAARARLEAEDARRYGHDPIRMAANPALRCPARGGAQNPQTTEYPEMNKSRPS